MRDRWYERSEQDSEKRYDKEEGNNGELRVTRSSTNRLPAPSRFPGSPRGAFRTLDSDFLQPVRYWNHTVIHMINFKIDIVNEEAENAFRV